MIYLIVFTPYANRVVVTVSFRYTWQMEPSCTDMIVLLCLQQEEEKNNAYEYYFHRLSLSLPRSFYRHLYYNTPPLSLPYIKLEALQATEVRNVFSKVDKEQRYVLDDV
jgi:hypothetical protein